MFLPPHHLPTMHIYKLHCYEDSDLVNALASEAFWHSHPITAVSFTAPDTFAIQVSDDGTPATYYYLAPACDRAGFINSYTGLAVSDAIELSALATLAVCLAFAAKLLRKAL